jgi:Fe2+ or Zn2+ uptake regulation protein
MVIHKRIRLTPHDRQKIWQLWQTGQYKVSALAERYRVSRPTIYKTLARARKQEFLPRKSVNERFRPCFIACPSHSTFLTTHSKGCKKRHVLGNH